jgi:hypothetical protein
VPAFMLASSGAAAILVQITQRKAALRTIVCAVAVALLGARFVLIAPDVVTLPREANRDAAEVVEARGAQTKVLTYMRNPQNLAFYLDRTVEDLEGTDIAAIVCSQTSPVFYVVQPFALEDVPVSCLSRPRVQHVRFRQYARGDEMNVWFVPPAS